MSRIFADSLIFEEQFAIFLASSVATRCPSAENSRTLNLRMETMKFTKMHGIGNDYVYVDLLAESDLQADWPEVARFVSDRHKGIGGDGLILVARAQDGIEADGRMVMFNADGSESEMCGNGLRCVAKVIYDRGYCRRDQLRIQTGNGVLAVDVINGDGNTASLFRVNMGDPILVSERIPTSLPGDPPVNRQLSVEVDGRIQMLTVTCVSMGNPHCIVFLDEVTDRLVHTVGPLIENHPAFPRRTNVEFVVVNSPTEFTQRTWERGSGETQACGTGASAVCVAGVLTGRMERKVLGHLLGGDLELEWIKDGPVMMTGSATTVFTGEITLP